MIKQLIQEGFILKNNGYYKHAIESFYKALEFDNKSLELLLEIAECYYLMQDEERAFSYIEQILETNPAHTASLNMLKNIFISKKLWNEAVQVNENIFAITQDNENLIDILRLLNKKKKYSEALNYQPEINDTDFLYEKAYAALYINEIEKANNYINLALKSSPDNSKILILQGKILFKQGKEEDCYKLFQRIEINEKDADMLCFAGLVEQQQGNYKNSISYLLLAVGLEPQNHEFYYHCASTYFKMGDIAQAKKYYNLAISLSPETPSYHIALANLYYSEKQFRRALEELDFDIYEANFLKSAILHDSGYYAMSLKGFKALKEERPNDFMVDEYLKSIEEKLKI